MHRIYSALIDIVAAAIFIVPLLALYGKISLRSLKQTLIYIVFAFYLVAVLSLVGFPSVLSLNLDFTINIIPLVDMISDFVNACLNVLLFVPLGFLLPMLWKKYKAIKNTMLFAMCMTIAIEISQIFTFRTTDIMTTRTASGSMNGGITAATVPLWNRTLRRGCRNTSAFTMSMSGRSRLPAFTSITLPSALWTLGHSPSRPVTPRMRSSTTISASRLKMDHFWRGGI